VSNLFDILGHLHLILYLVICCGAMSEPITHRDRYPHLKSPRHAPPAMHGKAVAKVDYHAKPVNIEVSPAYLLRATLQADNNVGSMNSTLCRLFRQSIIFFLTHPLGLLINISIFTLILSIQRGRFSIEVHLMLPKTHVCLFNPLSQWDCG
jgi:hypothetical protein